MLIHSPPTEFPGPSSAPLSSTTSPGLNPGLNVLSTDAKAFGAPTVGRVLKAIFVNIVPKRSKNPIRSISRRKDQLKKT
jgi:hypothetical protein